ncbi:Uncharacterised protein [Mycobacterium tuberculosis]|nr:Uncharacterised protein [Mycobacterium tuberculosis]
MGDCPALQQAAVAGQQNSLLAQADIGQRRIIGGTRPPCVEAQQPKQPRQLAEVDVDDEARVTQRRWAQPGGRPDVEGLEHRVGGNAVAGDRPVGKVRGIAVHQDEIHLGMRNAHRLQHIFDRLMAAERPAHRQTARLQLHELVELGVCPDIHIADHSLSSPAGSREGNGVRAPGRDRLEDLQYRRGASTVEVWPFARVDGNRGCTVDSSFA